MGNTVKLTYSRRFTNKLPDGSFEGFELGGDAELEIGEVESIDDVNDAYNQLYQQFVANVEAKVLEVQDGIAPKQSAVKEPQDTSESRNDRLASWVKSQVDENTEKIRPKAAATLPGERFKSPPRQKEEEPAEIVEGEAVAYENLKVFLDNKSTKVGRTQRGGKYAMLRLGGRGQVPGDYVTAKAFEPPEVVNAMAEVIENETPYVDIYGYWEPRNNDPDVFDLVVQGIKPTER